LYLIYSTLVSYSTVAAASSIGRSQVGGRDLTFRLPRRSEADAFGDKKSYAAKLQPK